MNNKIVKRFAAVVLGVAVLSTCAFASTITSADYAKATTTLTYNINSTADKISYIAYAATKVADGTEGATVVDGTSYTLGEIVAVNQIDNHTAGDTGNTAVSIAEAKLSGATHVVLMTGDSAGAAVAKKAMAIDEYAIATSIQNAGTLKVTIGDTTYSDCPNFNVEVTINKAGGAKFTGLKKVYNGVEENFSSVTGLPSNVTTIGATGGKITLANVYIVGIPTDGSVDVSKLKIKPEFEYGLQVTED